MIKGNINNSPVRQVKGKVELYEGSTLLTTYTYRDRLKSFKVERVGESSKFFGFGVCQKITIKLLDKDRELEITTANSFKAYLTTGEEYYNPFPIFYVTEVHRDENTNELSITAYDLIYFASGITFTGITHTINDYLSTPIEGYIPNLGDFAISCVKQLEMPDRPDFNLPPVIIPEEITANFDAFEIQYEQGANLEGTESIKDVLDDIAEATQTIYFIGQWQDLINGPITQVFRFERIGAPDETGAPKEGLTIGKSDYIDLDTKTNRRLTAICHATQLGDNVEAALEVSGTTQYVRDNAFWELREDIDALVENALAAIGGLTINQFECSWRGNYLLEPGDRIDMVTKDDEVVSSYILNDVIEYDGALSQKTSWKFEDNEGEVASNPSTLGETLKQTFARVDKVNKEITMMATSVKAQEESTAALQLTVEDIAGKVTSIEEVTTEAFGGVNESIATLTQTVETKITDEEVGIKISEALSNGVDKVETSTGFIFDETGLTVSKTDSEMSTTITEDGMQVFQNEDAVLTANNIGVDAKNLHATTYLIIGTNSRFEDYGSDRTGCFWIGGNS